MSRFGPEKILKIVERMEKNATNENTKNILSELRGMEKAMWWMAYFEEARIIDKAIARIKVASGKSKIKSGIVV